MQYIANIVTNSFSRSVNVVTYAIPQQTGAKDADQIYSAIDWRIQQLKVSSKPQSDSTDRSSPGGSHGGGAEPQLKRQRGATDQDDSNTPKKQRSVARGAVIKT